MDIDPLRELEPWARKTERRIGRAHRFGQLRTALRRPFRPRRFRPRRLLALVMVVLAATALWLSRENWMQWGQNRGDDTSSVPPGSGGPFDGTPAASFAQGEAGITIPDATAVDGWTVQQVAETLGQVRQALIAGHLDRKALIDHDLSALQGLLASSSRKQLQWVVRISPTVTLSAEVPRVKGTTTVRGTTTDLEYGPGATLPVATLEVVTNYVFVYAFDVLDRGIGSRVAVVHTEVTWRVYDPTKVTPPDRGLGIHQSSGYGFNIDCAEAAEGRLAPPPQGDVADGSVWPPPANEDPSIYYDPNRGLDVPDACK